MDAARQRTERRRQTAAGTIRPEFVDIMRGMDDEERAHAAHVHGGNRLFRDVLLATHARAEGDASAIRVYTDGSYVRGAGWGWVALRGDVVLAHDCGGVVTDVGDKDCDGCQFHSNNAGEINAIVRAGRWLRDNCAGEKCFLIPDSWWAIACTRGMIPKHHRRAATMAAALREEVGFEVGWVKGHSGHKWNNRADDLANEGRAKAEAQLEADRLGDELAAAHPGLTQDTQIE